jgi:hypothetical protein
MTFLEYNTIAPKPISTTKEHLKTFYQMAKLVLILLIIDVWYYQT